MAYTLDLFAAEPTTPGERQALGNQAWLLRGFALPWAEQLLPALLQVRQQAPLRHLVTPGGFTMSVGMTNCGPLGWTSDRRGYRYSPVDPNTGRAWPAMPGAFLALAQAAAREAGFEGFAPDACLVNHYRPGSRLTLHQDRDEHDLSAPIVSVSLGLPAVFQWGGLARGDRTVKVPLQHGDVVVWGGEDRLRYHGVLPLKEGEHPRLGPRRVNLTFRQAGAPR
ncbi:DNA oxidative demethylase AlkB [Pseudomonas typographi]|uniref:DNA oxidative demethylase AlkB n=1 Tax=Pseudomonas typographi TaxID=2715964 RepID=A0ABR7YZW3_9PSED|nr:DNA oxidative demethylase AlkB [Pseudomonas typographi]MBD1550600.1 DNA oxidative demethylase AlkB [Pseudomonas typographi]MBD1586815.1 DNA oxidative demethylase AlkB [Pseudomonas typographi]MBD1598709.1 DNA oxidative demethylase AlkB [Pseudomonas typographi]